MRKVDYDAINFRINSDTIILGPWDLHGYLLIGR